MVELNAFLSGAAAPAVSTEHYAYSNVTLKSYAASHLVVIRSAGPIPFTDMALYFTQADPFEDFVNDSDVHRAQPPWFAASMKLG